MSALRRCNSDLVRNSSSACSNAPLASCSLPSLVKMSASAVAAEASTSTTRARAVSSAASCRVLSSLKSGSPFLTF